MGSRDGGKLDSKGLSEFAVDSIRFAVSKRLFLQSTSPQPCVLPPTLNVLSDWPGDEKWPP